MSSSPKKTRAPAKNKASQGLSLTFWGVRGSVPSPGPETARYGGNTPCIEVRIDGERVIFDLGTGARSLGQASPGPMKAHIFISHYHYDHVQGLPFFTPIFDPRNHFIMHGPTRNGRTVKDVISEQMQQPFFPVTAEMVFRAQLEYQPFSAGDKMKVGRGSITAIETNHPGGNLAYRIDYPGKSIVYATDTEHGTERDAQLLEFARDADLLIYDAMYTDEEYLGRTGVSKLGWGHSTFEQSIKLANEARVGTLVLFHHEPTRSDKALDALVKQLRKKRKATIAAREGMTIRV